MDEVTHVSVEALYRDMAEQLSLQWVAGRTGGQRAGGVAVTREGIVDRLDQALLRDGRRRITGGGWCGADASHRPRPAL